MLSQARIVNPSHIIEFVRELRHQMTEGASAVHEKRDVTAPGIVVLSSSLDLLHMNRRALALLTQLEQTAQNVETERTVTAPLHQHGQDIIETMQARLAANNWEPFHHYRAIGPASHTILLKGFGIPDRRGLSHSRIVMLLSPHRPSPMPNIGNRESSNGTPENSHAGTDSPRAIGL